MSNIVEAAKREAKRRRVRGSDGNEYGLARQTKMGFVDGAEWVASRATRTTREQIADVIQAHTKQLDTEECCGLVIRDFATQVLHWADAVLALLKGEENE